MPHVTYIAIRYMQDRSVINLNSPAMVHLGPETSWKKVGKVKSRNQGRQEQIDLKSEAMRKPSRYRFLGER